MTEKTNTMTEIGKCIWKIKGEKPGTAYIVSGGIHGNEKTGAHVVRRIKENVENGNLRVRNGSLTLLLGNLRAIELDERYTDSRVDLNRCFTNNLADVERQSYEAMRASEIMSALHIEDHSPDSIVGIDIHSTNTPSIPCLVSQKIPNHLYEIALPHLKTAEALLCDPDLIFAGELVTTDEYYARRGLGLCYETGHADDLSRIEIIYDEIVSLGKSLGVFETDGSETSITDYAPPIYTLRESLLLTDKGFEYAPGFGAGNFEPFSKGDTIGYHGTEPAIASFSGVFIFPMLKKHWKIGKPLGYLTECPPQ